MRTPFPAFPTHPSTYPTAKLRGANLPLAMEKI